jgi:hypothetical protein
MYRFHIEDPVRFTTSLKVSIEHGHANDQGNDYSSVAYWYQTGKHADHAELAPMGRTGFPGAGPSTACGTNEPHVESASKP